jgi:hypothetical protein
MSETDSDGLAEREYIPGKHRYHEQAECANRGIQSPEKTSLIQLSRTELTPCKKCQPPEKPTEFAVCLDCERESPVGECERNRGYKGACPACGSPKTTSEFRLSQDTDQTDPREVNDE